LYHFSDGDDRYWPIYPEIGHIPFLVAAPDVPKGNSLPLLAQPMDFLPTVCNLADVEINPPEPIDGRSFADALRAGSGHHRDFAVSGCYIRARQAGSIPHKATTPFLVTEKWGYAPVGANGAPELYDLSADPLAANDISTDHEDVVTKLFF
jgi:arylsulfatase A-like enzyme